MTQANLIARLKAVEEAFEAAEAHLEYAEEGKLPKKIADALSDLRELIKEAEGQVPVGVVRKDSEADVYWWLIERESSREVKRGQSLYTALGEKP